MSAKSSLSRRPDNRPSTATHGCGWRRTGITFDFSCAVGLISSRLPSRPFAIRRGWCGPGLLTWCHSTLNSGPRFVKSKLSTSLASDSLAMVSWCRIRHVCFSEISHRMRASSFDRRQSIGQHGGEDGDQLTIAIVGAGEPSSHPLRCGRQHPVPERRTVAQSARLASQDRHVVPRVVDRLPSTGAGAVFRDDASVLADHDAIGVGMDLDGPGDRAGVHRIFVVVEAHQAGL